MRRTLHPPWFTDTVKAFQGLYEQIKSLETRVLKLEQALPASLEPVEQTILQIKQMFPCPGPANQITQAGLEAMVKDSFPREFWGRVVFKKAVDKLVAQKIMGRRHAGIGYNVWMEKG